MAAERPIAPPDAMTSGVHRIDAALEAAEARRRPSLDQIEPMGRTPAAPGIGDFAPTDLGAAELYLNRELTYLNFCWRVCNEAADERLPLLERVKFLAIVASNIDEFFQKRIGGLKQQVGAQVHSVTHDGRTPQQQIADCLELVTKLERRKAQILEKVKEDLKAAGVWIAPFKELDAQQRASIREYYVRNIFPLVTPQAMDP